MSYIQRLASRAAPPNNKAAPIAPVGIEAAPVDGVVLAVLAGVESLEDRTESSTCRTPLASRMSAVTTRARFT
jgi:hypothetical protein